MFKKIKKFLLPANKGFDPNISFFGLRVVRVTVALWGIIFIVVSGFCVCTLPEKYVLDISFHGWNTLAFEILKVPITFLAILIPVGAVYATNHKSQQSIEAARLTQVQNSFSNYYKHVDEFEKYAEKYNSLKWFGQSNKVTSISSRQLHGILYGNEKKSTDYQANTIVLRRVFEIVSKMDADIEYHSTLVLNSDKASFTKKINDKYKEVENIISNSVDIEQSFFINGKGDNFRYRHLLSDVVYFSSAYHDYSKSIVIFYLLVYLFRFDGTNDVELMNESNALIARIGLKLNTKFYPQNR